MLYFLTNQPMYNIRIRLARVKTEIRRIKDNPGRLKRPQDCLTHLSLIEMKLEDQLYSLTH